MYAFFPKKKNYLPMMVFISLGTIATFYFTNTPENGISHNSKSKKPNLMLKDYPLSENSLTSPLQKILFLELNAQRV